MSERHIYQMRADIDLMKLLDWVNELLVNLSPVLSKDVDVIKIGDVWIAKVYV